MLPLSSSLNLYFTFAYVFYLLASSSLLSIPLFCFILQQDPSSDWRADIMKAVSNVFAKERTGLLADLHTHSVLNPEQQPTIQELEKKIEAQVRGRSSWVVRKG